MRAALLPEYKKVEITEMEVPKIGPHDLLIKVMAVGLCPNDYRLYAGIATYKKPPLTLGHEPSGEVVKIGDAVKEFKPGDKVAGDGSLRCGRCRPCIEGRENLCMSRTMIGNASVAEYQAVSEVYMNKFERASFDEEALTEPLSCVINGSKNSKISAGDTVAIVGAGQIGLMHTQVARLKGARTIVLDIKQERLDVAKKVGANYTINSSTEDPVAKVKELTSGAGADKVIVAIGNAPAIETGLQLVAKMGIVNLFASTHPPTKISVDPNLIHHNEISLVGSYDKTRSDLKLATRLIDEGKVDTKSLISHRFKLEDTIEALKMLERGQGLKIVVQPNGGS